jgi:hypothetical protein
MTCVYPLIITAGVADAISRIAGSLQSLLQNTRLSATNVTLKIELPLAPCDGDSRRSSGGGSCEDPQVAVITVSLDKLEVSEQQQVAAPAGAGSGKVAAAAAAAAAAVAAGVTQRSGGHTSRDAKSSPGGDAASEVNKVHAGWHMGCGARVCVQHNRRTVCLDDIGRVTGVVPSLWMDEQLPVSHCFTLVCVTCPRLRACRAPSSARPSPWRACMWI